MKYISSLFLLLHVVNVLPAQAAEVETPELSKKPALIVQGFENRNGPLVDPKWNFLKQGKGPSSDPISNGVIDRLARALVKTGQFAVTAHEPGSTQHPVYRGLPQEGRSTSDASSSHTPPFIVRGDVSFSGDHITIVIRLVDTQTNKVVKATTVEGRPEDITRWAAPLSGSPEERVVQAAIEKAVASIQGALLQWVVVKAFAMKVRQEPSVQSVPLATVRQGDRLQKIAEDGEWVRVQLNNGETGWVPFALVETSY